MKNNLLLIISPVPPPQYGAAVMTESLIHGLKEKKYVILHVDAKYNNSMESISRFGLGKIFKMIGFLFEIVSIKLRNPVRYAIYCPAFKTGPFLKDSIFILLLVFLRMKVIFWFHMEFRAFELEEKNWLFRKWVEFILRLSYKSICLGHSLIKDLPISIQNRTIPIANGIPDRTKNVSRSTEKKKVVKILYISHMQKLKGWEILFDAAVEICRKNQQCEFLFYGEPSPEYERKFLEDKFSNSPYIKRIKYMGGIYDEDKEKVLENADLFVFPTLMESFGIAALEAMRASLPVIAFAVGTLPDIIEDKKGGFIIPIENRKLLVDKIVYLVNNPTVCKKFGKYNREKFLQEYVIDKFINRWDDFLRTEVFL